MDIEIHKVVEKSECQWLITEIKDFKETTNVASINKIHWIKLFPFELRNANKEAGIRANKAVRLKIKDRDIKYLYHAYLSLTLRKN